MLGSSLPFSNGQTVTKKYFIYLCAKHFQVIYHNYTFFLSRSFMIQFHFLPFSFPHSTPQLHGTGRAARMPQAHASLIIFTVSKNSFLHVWLILGFPSCLESFHGSSLAAKRCQMILLFRKHLVQTLTLSVSVTAPFPKKGTSPLLWHLSGFPNYFT